jgi:hypothetical protein
MKLPMIALVCSLGGLEGAILPVGTEIYLRLTTAASSDKPSGAIVSAVVIAPVLLNGLPALNAGAQLTGNTADAAAAQVATDAGGEKPATLRIQFTKIADASGHSQQLSCT